MDLGEEILRRQYKDESLPDFTSSFCTIMVNIIDETIENYPKIYSNPEISMFFDFLELKRSKDFK